MVATVDHCLFCFDTLISHLSDIPKDNDLAPNFDNLEFPLFVTWNKLDNGQKKLRGCIGNFSPLPLYTGLKQYALLSALKDPRFQPIHDQELPYLACSVSLLVQFEEAQDYMDWEVGKHGIRIRFDDPVRNTNHSATFLPEVASDQGWDKNTTLQALIKKSGYHGQVTKSLLESIQVVRYQSSKAVADYEDYSAWKGSKNS